MGKVDMKKLYEATAERIEELEDDFIDAIEADEDFFKYGDEDRAVYKHKLLHRGSLEIALESIDDLKGELSKVKYIAPTKPEKLVGDIERYKTHVFDDARLDGFEAKLKSIFGGFKSPTAFSLTGMDFATSIQDAFYSFHYARDFEDLVKKIDDNAAQWAADGYEMGPGSMGHDHAEMANQFDRERDAKTSGVFGELAGIVQQNIQWSIENGVQIEDLHMDFAIAYSELSKVFIQSEVDAYIAEIDKRISEQAAQISIIDALTKAQGLDVQADIAKNTLELKERTARLNAYTQATNTYIDTEAGSIIEELKLAANIAEGYGGLFASYGSMFTGISYEEE